MRFGRIAAVMLLGMSVTGCATVIRGTSTKVVVESVPTGATVKTDRGLTCTTPCHFQMSRQSNFDVTVSMDGYASQTVHVKSKAAAAGVVLMTGGNFLAGGIIGSAVDVADGATNDLVPNPVKVVLVKTGDQPPTPAATSSSNGGGAGAGGPTASAAPAATN